MFELPFPARIFPENIFKGGSLRIGLHRAYKYIFPSANPRWSEPAGAESDETGIYVQADAFGGTEVDLTRAGGKVTESSK